MMVAERLAVKRTDGNQSVPSPLVGKLWGTNPTDKTSDLG